MEYIDPYIFNAIRCTLGAIALLPVVYFTGRAKPKEERTSVIHDVKHNKMLHYGGIACGLVLFCAVSLQQMGIVYTTAGKAGFITTLYIVLVPVMGIALRKKIRKLIWLCVALAVIGLYLLCINEGFSINCGDLLVFVGAFFWAGHIIVIDRFTPHVDGVKLSCIQFFIVGLLSFIPAFAFETINWGAVLDCWFPIVYSAVFNCSIAFTLQIIGQKTVEPTIASLLLSLESVFSVIFGFMLLGEMLTLREGLGCVVMFTAVILAQLPQKKEGDSLQ